MKSKVLGDLEGHKVTERAKVRRCTAVEYLVHQDGNFGCFTTVIILLRLYVCRKFVPGDGTGICASQLLFVK